MLPNVDMIMLFIFSKYTNKYHNMYVASKFENFYKILRCDVCKLLANMYITM